MKLDEILSAAGKYKRRKRVGRGTGSGMGKTSGRGHKGYGSRAGAKKRLGYEGGQAPMISRIPKRGFNNKNFRTEYQVINLAALEQRFEDGAKVDAEALKASRMIEDATKPVKILGNGEIKKKLTVIAQKFSATAREKIAAVGGSVEEVK
ncbi:MAG: 50S ribosomal protein L15 [Phycisphaerae bacterium]|nr:50S ribosomal protein L15 [Phycisphaerae bacterium]